jgi:hypothetical protein
MLDTNNLTASGTFAAGMALAEHTELHEADYIRRKLNRLIRIIADEWIVRSTAWWRRLRLGLERLGNSIRVVIPMDCARFLLAFQGQTFHRTITDGFAKTFSDIRPLQQFCQNTPKMLERTGSL